MNGTATRKSADGRRFDGPPAGTVVASAPLSGKRGSATIEVTIPTAPSPRPDGRHFFYAIAYAGKSDFPARAWTGPLLTTPHASQHAATAGPAFAAGHEDSRPAPTAVFTAGAPITRRCGCRA